MAHRLQPIILFIDEIDVLLSSRGDGFNSTYQNQLIGEFLTAWDGFDQSDGAIVVIGATNRISSLDEAILRRLPLKVEVPLPDLKARREIFEAELVRDSHFENNFAITFEIFRILIEYIRTKVSLDPKL